MGVSRPPIRTITLGVAEPHPLPHAAIEMAAGRVRRAAARYRESGHDVQTVRLSTRPIFEDLAGWPDAEVIGYRVGDPRDPSTDLGPLISAAALERVRGYIRSGIHEGAVLAAGGTDRPAGLENGYYVQPTVFHSVDVSMTIAQQEIFGPVLSVMPYRDEDEAARIANATRYGLHGAVWSADVDHAKAFARRIRSGVIDINGGEFNILAPFGGMKQSGVGRECGIEGLDAFCEIKSLQLPAGLGEPTGPRIRSA